MFFVHAINENRQLGVQGVVHCQLHRLVNWLKQNTLFSFAFADFCQCNRFSNLWQGIRKGFRHKSRSHPLTTLPVQRKLQWGRNRCSQWWRQHSCRNSIAPSQKSSSSNSGHEPGKRVADVWTVQSRSHWTWRLVSLPSPWCLHQGKVLRAFGWKTGKLNKKFFVLVYEVKSFLHVYNTQ